VLNRQRTVIYDERRKVLSGADLHDQIRNMVNDVIEGYVYAATARATRTSGTSSSCGRRSARSTPSG
jgi:preprotein translocase subunit SecA